MEVYLILSVMMLTILGNYADEGTDRETFTIHPLRNNPGIYYEEMDPVHTTIKTWTITVAVDVKGTLNAHQLGWEDLQRIFDYCKTVVNSQKQELKCEQLLKIHEQGKLQEQILKIQNHLKSLLEIRDEPQRVRRTAPVFGFISRILGPIVGFTDYTEHEHLVNEVKKLYDDKNEIAKILRNSTHILQSEIDANHNYLKITRQNMNMIKQDIQALSTALNVTSDRVLRLEFIFKLMLLGVEALSTTEHYKMSLEKIVQVIENAKHGQITADLLTHDQLTSAIKDIKTEDSNLLFPVELESPDLGLLSRVSNVQLITSEGKVIVIITVPLADKTPLKLFRMIPCKMPQQLARNVTGSAFIQPSTKYLLITLDRQYYFKADVEYLQNCEHVGTSYLCPTHSLRQNKEVPCCEVELLVNPSIEAMKTCDVKILKNHITQWTQLSESRSWLYSTAQPLTLNIVCKKTLSYATEIKGTGTLHLSPGCEARTNTDIIRSMGTTRSKLPDLHVAPLNLNLSLLSPKLVKEVELPHLIKTIKLEPLPNNSHENDMHIYEHTLDLITNHNMDPYNSNVIHMGITGFIGIGVTILLIILCILGRKINCLLSCCCSKNKKKPVREETTPRRPIVSSPQIVYQPSKEKVEIHCPKSTIITRPSPSIPPRPSPASCESDPISYCIPKSRF